MPADGADRPTSHVRATKRPTAPRWTVLLRCSDGLVPIWTSKAWTEPVFTSERAMEIACKGTGRNPVDLVVKETV